MISIKNCGLKRPEEITHAAATGASFVGLVHHADSPRHLDITAMAALAAFIPQNVYCVVVLVNPEDALLDSILTHFRPDYWQIHGMRDAARIAAIKQRTGTQVISAISVSTAQDIIRGQELAATADMLLFDTKHETLPGGSGETFDWGSLVRPAGPFLVAGGLTPDNVAQAIVQMQPWGVDVSGGVELQGGAGAPRKDAQKVRDFVERARAAFSPTSAQEGV
jgi:phosphoribosylanthranilate isomerase